MSEYFYPDHDNEAFLKRINERLAPVAEVAEVKNEYDYWFKVEATEPISEIFIKGQTFKEIVREVAAKHYRAPATFKGDEFWFFALP